MASKTKKIKLSERSGESDPRAPLDSAALLAASTPLLKRLEADLRARVTASPAVQRALEARWEAEKKAERTAESFAGWSAALATQVAAAWLLSCVFVRTLEDRGLLRQPRLAGPGALDSQKLFFQLAPSLTERDYLLMVFRELSRHPAARDLFDAEHSLVWKLSPSAELAKELLALFRTPSAETPAFRFGQPSTRFLGDLYQDLSEDVRKRYALLQTPDFIESFILDRTLEPAIERFGVDDTTLIDPTCGSGHFLLGAFDRLFEHRLKKEPGVDVRVAAQKALDAVYGTDINPYAVAIARFRLALSFLEKAGFAKLADAPALPLHVVVADSLLHNPHQAQKELAHLDGQSAAAWGGDAFALEDEAEARKVLYREYAAVVGNPPYITEKDKARRDRYRVMYPRSAAREFSLAAPFCERFFQLARRNGLTGQITANAFMKREFGKKLIEEFLPSVNLELVINTSGAYIPGHGTPTVLLFGSNVAAAQPTVLTVLAKRGEPSTPSEPSHGEVWSSIAEHWSEVGFDNDYISVTRADRARFATHPWSLGGGGAMELKELLELRATQRLADLVELVGFGAVTREDDVFVLPKGSRERYGLPDDLVRPYGFGETVRDWVVSHEADIVFPYSPAGTVSADRLGAYYRILWCYRTQLWERQGKGFKTKKQSGGEFYEYSMFYPERHYAPLRIAFAFVATHNHFVLDPGGRVFNRSAPIIKLPEGASEDDHLALLAYLNSSTACFWMKQIFHDKGGGTDAGKWQSEKAKVAYEFTGTGLESLPIPNMTPGDKSRLCGLASRMLSLAAERDVLAARSIGSELAWHELASRLSLAALKHDELTKQLISIQEEIDWLVYGLFGLRTAAEPSQQTDEADTGVLGLGHRPFEVYLAESGATTGIDGQTLMRDYSGMNDRNQKRILEARLELIRTVPEVRNIEVAHYKRRWAVTPKNLAGRVLAFDDLLRPLLRNAILDALEVFIREVGSPQRWSSISTATAERVDPAMSILHERDVENDDLHVIMKSEAVPYVAALRFSETGLRKHEEWRSTWDAQRREDFGMPADPRVPPKYQDPDFADERIAELRGKLDVPKERFISYPGCESDEDGEPIYGWAGWNHLQRTQALASLYIKRRDGESWGKDRLTPMLAGLLELLPWVKQWHNEPSQEFDGQRMGDYFEMLLDGECRRFGLSHDDLLAWRPAKKTRGKAAKPNKTGASASQVFDAAGGSDAAVTPAEAAASQPRRPRKKKTAAAEASTIDQPEPEDAPGDPSA